MNWIADNLASMVGGGGAAAAGGEPKAAAAGGASGASAADNITVYANGGGSASDGSADEREAAAEADLSALANKLTIDGAADQQQQQGGEGYLEEMRKAIFQPANVAKYIGMDVTGLMSVPLFIMEPFSMLQKLGEYMEYTDLLDLADESEDPYERLALVAAFLVTPFGCAERTWKPFNPILGETFELEGAGPNKDVRFLAEQVSDAPAVSAAHAENGKWCYDLVSAPTTKFLGNSLEVFPKGRTRITLLRTGEEFSHVPPTAKVHNLVLGKTWVDASGTFLVTNMRSKARCQLEFKACGWFGAGQHEFEGHVFDEAGAAKLALSGKWNSHVDISPCGADGTPVVGGGKRRVWSCAPKPEGDPYGCTLFSRKMGTCELLQRPPLPSDSRRRPDIVALAARSMAAAAAEKGALEQQLAEEGKARAERGQPFAPRWFEPAQGKMTVFEGEEPADVVPLWRFSGKYNAEKRESMPAGEDGWRDKVLGQGFVPWQFRTTPVPSAAAAAAGGAGAAGQQQQQPEQPQAV